MFLENVELTIAKNILNIKIIQHIDYYFNFLSKC